MNHLVKGSPQSSVEAGVEIDGKRYYNLTELTRQVGRSRWYLSMMVRAGFVHELSRRSTVTHYVAWHKENPYFVAKDYESSPIRKRRGSSSC
ncbi:hypothetical protein [Rubritalea profundi]|jgi:hypothetical protein|uniref:hypothetical protein n=1 Tax=Rubritalea profundi TaxID=1658618 RepID=UPI00101ADD14|nr:hypothetical protein [Rubritalea profundi]